MRKNYYVYIIGNDGPTLYIGVTNDIARRAYEHKQGLADGFSKKYELYQLLHVEVFESIESAILREKQLKRWNRE